MPSLVWEQPAQLGIDDTDTQTGSLRPPSDFEKTCQNSSLCHVGTPASYSIVLRRCLWSTSWKLKNWPLDLMNNVWKNGLSFLRRVQSEKKCCKLEPFLKTSSCMSASTLQDASVPHGVSAALPSWGFQSKRDVFVRSWQQIKQKTLVPHSPVLHLVSWPGASSSQE